MFHFYTYCFYDRNSIQISKDSDVGVVTLYIALLVGLFFLIREEVYFGSQHKNN